MSSPSFLIPLSFIDASLTLTKYSAKYKWDANLSVKSMTVSVTSLERENIKCQHRVSDHTLLSALQN